MSKRTAMQAYSRFYERVPLTIPGVWGRTQRGFFYARVPSMNANYVEVGLGYESPDKLNLQHQQLDQVHHAYAIPYARRISQGQGSRMVDGPLTARFFGDEQAYRDRVRIMSVGGALRAPRSEDLYSERTLSSPELGAAIVRAQRAVFGDPLGEGSTVIELPEEHSDVNIVVRPDPRIRMLTIGVAPKHRGPEDVPTHLIRDPHWEHHVFAQLSKRLTREAVARWSESDKLQFGPVAEWSSGNPRLLVPDALFVEGEALTQLVEAVRRYDTPA